jgi:hypothetical protein
VDAVRETPILQDILLAIGALPVGRFWRNNAGKAWAGVPVRLKPGQVYRAEQGDVLLKRGHPVKLGPTGSADILGLIGPHGKLFAFEVKTESRHSKQTEEQARFAEMVKKYGGIYEVVRSKEEALAIIFSHAKVGDQ